MRKFFRKGGQYMCMLFLAAIAAFVAESSVWAEDGNTVKHSYRWMVTETPKEKLAPPLKLLWNRSPIITLFNRFGAGTYGMEAPNRRLVDTPYGLAVILKRKLYLLDKENGSTRWALQLQGDGIMDWKVQGDFLAYSASETESGYGIHAVVDLKQGNSLWSRKEIPNGYYSPEWVIIDNETVVFGTDTDGEAPHNNLSVYALKTGKLQWEKPNGIADVTLIPASWFVYKDRLYAIISERGSAASPSRSGLYLQGYELSTGEKLPLVPVFGEGEGKVGNLYLANALREDGIFFIEYSPTFELKTSLVAYNIEERKVLWETSLFVGEDAKKGYIRKYIKNVLLGRNAGDLLAMTVWPNYFFAVNQKDGAVIKKQSIPNYKWDDHNPVLYSYPYLFTGARRVLDEGSAYDLIALNVESGSVDWSYEIDRSKSNNYEEILNFVVSDNTIYVARTDGRIMAFQSHAPRSESQP